MFVVWLNVDRPTKKCTIHSDENCIYVVEKGETPYKGLEKMKKDGGWFSFKNIADAERFCKTRFPDYELVRHC